jgi:hypothetical protein
MTQSSDHRTVGWRRRLCCAAIVLLSASSAAQGQEPGCNLSWEPDPPPAGLDAGTVVNAPLSEILKYADSLDINANSFSFRIPDATLPRFRGRVHGGLCRFPQTTASQQSGRLLGRVVEFGDGFFGIPSSDTSAFIWADEANGNWRVVVIGSPSGRRTAHSAVLTRPPKCAAALPICTERPGNDVPRLVIGPLKNGDFLVVAFP